MERIAARDVRRPHRLAAEGDIARGFSLATRALAATLSASTAAGGCSPPPSADGSQRFETAAHAPYPQIPTGGGPTLAAATIVTVSFAGDVHSADLATFVDWLSQSNWLASALAEYGVKSLAHLPHVALGAAAPASLTGDDVESLLAGWIASGTVPAAPAAAPPYLYVVFFPAGTSVTPRSAAACSGSPGNGYHDAMVSAAGQVPYAVLPTCDPRFTAILSQEAGMELDTARLLADAVTDPSPGNEPGYALTDASNPWTALGVEVGDFCWGRLAQAVPGYTLQRVWSNRAAAGGGDPCTPETANGTAFGVTALPSGLPSLQVGIPSVFTLTGWSRAPVADWALQANPWIGDYAIGVALDRDTLNNGETASLTITIPYPVPSGTYGAVRLQSLAAGDATSWPVAFLVQ